MPAWVPVIQLKFEKPISLSTENNIPTLIEMGQEIRIDFPANLVTEFPVVTQMFFLNWKIQQIVCNSDMWIDWNEKST